MRIFDIHLLAKAFAAMFLDAPHDALGSPSRIYEQQMLFSKDGIEIAYYTASFSLYRIILMLGNNLIPRKDGLLKWHALMALRYQVLGALPLAATPEAIRGACRNLLEVIWQPPKESARVFNDAFNLVKSTSRASEQELRAKPFTEKLIAAAVAQHRAKVPKKKQRGATSKTKR